jgi:hypothetical protein
MINFNGNVRVPYNKTILKLLVKGVDVVEWSRALDVKLSGWCCSVSMVF